MQIFQMFHMCIYSFLKCFGVRANWFYLPRGLITLHGNFAVPPTITSTFRIGVGLSIAAKELNLSTNWGGVVIMGGLAVVAENVTA